MPAFEVRAITPADTYTLRHQVLWPDKPLEYVKVENDAAGLHFGAFLGEELVSVVSLFVEDSEARFRKFATHPTYQRQGIGSVLLKRVLTEARRHGATHIWCDARQDSADFYARFGLLPQGAEFFKGPIAYLRMGCEL
ncbi:GNAT family N-acetyltransferase [Hymenobacter tibetensis]|uniref:GNAT family N-acetyltransferase n=1 Tax=Hymenobacter tibetensis TaxID=497967 RepID=A0ABY4D2F6_9BACT|nr:GNAT family N-acetyltransferase [Hymenobacter tibetensis]UOG74138.1 GNAT family N-acetyltransferase [Hymenobacter tibetensis]